ncbi:MAG: hypothetical protein JXR03_20240 [Cyclobacteriaceae bacterium]
MSRILLFASIFVTTQFLVTGQEVGVINDSDGYTNIRLYANSKSEIVAKIIEKERFLYFPTTSSNWWKVKVFRKEKEIIEGFVHNSRIQSIYREDSNSNLNLKKLYHEFDRTASSFRTSRRNIDTTNLPRHYFVETIDGRGRVIDIKFFENGSIIDDRLCYLSPWIKYECPNESTIIQYNLNANGTILSDIECETWYKTIYNLNDERTEIVNTEVLYLIDTAKYINTYGWPKEQLLNTLKELHSNPPKLRMINGYEKSVAKLNGLFPTSKEFDIKIYWYTGLEFEELKEAINRNHSK